MKKMMIFLIIAMLVLSPVVSAQTYSGFDKFTDKIKFFFSTGDRKVMIALQIREKEINSAIENVQNENSDGAVDNLKNAREKLQIIQKKVSIDVAEEVKTSVDNVINTINNTKNLPEEFEVYVLEEEKTKLTAELVVVVEGKEGQTKVWEVQKELGEVNNDIKEWVVEKSVEGEKGDNGLTWEIKTDVKTGDYGGDDGLTPEIKTYVAGDGTLKDEPLPEPDLNQVNPDLYDPNARAPGDTIDETYDDDAIIGGNCGDGVVCGNGDSGVEGSNNIGEATGVIDGVVD